VIETLVRRFALVGVAILGAGWSLASDYYWQAKTGSDTLVGVSGDLIIAFPFYVLAVAAVVGRPRFIGTALTMVGLAVLAGVAYQAAATSSSSTAGLVFFLPLFYGTVLVAVAVLLQVLVDALRSRRTNEFVKNLSKADQADWARFVSGDPKR